MRYSPGRTCGKRTEPSGGGAAVSTWCPTKTANAFGTPVACSSAKTAAAVKSKVGACRKFERTILCGAHGPDYTIAARRSDAKSSRTPKHLRFRRIGTAPIQSNREPGHGIAALVAHDAANAVYKSGFKADIVAR